MGMALGEPYLWTMVCFLSRLCNISAMAVTITSSVSLADEPAALLAFILAQAGKTIRDPSPAILHQGLSQQASGMTARLQRGSGQQIL